MTDEQIIKALECCIWQGITSDCTECKYRYSSEGCVRSMLMDALDLIIRQKAEIERIHRHTEMYHEIKSEAIKEFAERVKEKTLAMVWSPELFSTADYIECIDSLVKETVGE